MTIDLTSAGTRGLQTLDSITDMQNSLKLVNMYFEKLQHSLSTLSEKSERVIEFVKNNPTVEVDFARPPVSNSPAASDSEIVFPSQDSPARSVSDPELQPIRIGDAKVFTASLDFRLVLIPLRSESIKNFF